ncbi:MAG: rpiA [Sphingomonas bacterium]|nr:ribose-5-phosphate isomerase RpiA [Sphingomonas bacterium]MDB5688578.1 rpiA [Sphingomonas bacterium]
MSGARADLDREKAAAARAAVAEVRDGMIVGIGTGSTVAFAIAALAERCAQGLRVTGVATSLRSDAIARAAGIAMIDFADRATVDLAIDGVDEIDGRLRAIKGAGGAMLREKIVAAAAPRMIAIADSRKLVDRLGQAPLPVEVLPFARRFVQRRIEELGGAPHMREDAAGSPYRTDQGNGVLDCGFGRIHAAAELAAGLSAIPGIMGHGLFVGEIDALYVGRGDTAEYRERPNRPG